MNKRNPLGGLTVGPIGRAQPRGRLWVEVPNDYARIKYGARPPDSRYTGCPYPGNYGPVYIERDPACVQWAEKQLWGSGG